MTALYNKQNLCAMGKSAFDWSAIIGCMSSIYGESCFLHQMRLMVYHNSSALVSIGNIAFCEIIAACRFIK